MAKTSKKVEETETVTTEATVEMNASAIGIVKKDGKYFTVKVPFNLDAGVVGNPEIVAETVNRGEAQTNFKLTVIQSGLFD